MLPRLLASAVVLALGLPLLATPAEAVRDPAAPRALERAEALLDGDPRTRVRREATRVMRDLALRLDDLAPADRAEARRLLARPTDYRPGDPHSGYETSDVHSDCTGEVCVHWVETTADASVPTWVEATRAVVEESWSTIVDTLGYRPPQPDTTSADPGPDARLDVYLADVGDFGAYGYCVPEVVPERATSDSPGYCVVDNDFAAVQYGGAPPLVSLQATVAHELFHAVQFGYDATEDWWLMEGTAAWMEDRVYPALHDNHRYLDESPLRQPWVSLDTTTYGAFVFWRFAEQVVATPGTTDPGVVRAVWELADGAPGAPDLRSVAATATALEQRGLRFIDAFAAFGAANLLADRWYAGDDAFRPTVPDLKVRLRDARPSASVSATPLHLSHATARMLPTRELTGKRRLRVVVDMPDTRHGSAVTLIVRRRSGGVRLKPVTLDATGAGRATVPFTRSTIAAVDVVVANAGVRAGDDWRRTTVQATALRR